MKNFHPMRGRINLTHSQKTLHFLIFIKLKTVTKSGTKAKVNGSKYVSKIGLKYCGVETRYALGGIF